MERSEFITVGVFTLIIGQFYDDDYWCITLDDCVASAFSLDVYKRFKDKSKLISWIEKQIRNKCEKTLKNKLNGV